MARQIVCYGVRLVPSAALFHFSSSRRVIGVIKVMKDDSTSKLKVKRATLSAQKKERIRLPDYNDGGVSKMYHISEFLSHPNGVETMLNVNALENYTCLDANTYRCRIPPIQLLNLVVAPVLDLQVNPTSEGCTVELLSCKLEGSKMLESRNKYFSASMTNFITWEENGSETYLDVDVQLKVDLQIFDRPFRLLPISAVEVPGNLVIQALLERYVPTLLQQLLQDYEIWVQDQKRNLP